MPNTLDRNGLVIKDVNEVTNDLVADFKSIYGDQINVDQNSPDGQIIGIMAQAVIDTLEFLASINTSFDPDHAQGSILDSRVAINNITRLGGTYTIQPISITTDRTVSLAGLDGDFNDPDGAGYTVQDDSGNEFILIDSTVLGAGTVSKNFRAKTIGEVSVPTGTITTPKTIVNGVTAVNNASAEITLGQNQETDAQLRTRRQQSVANATTGYLNGLLGAILALDGVTSAVLYENSTNTTDANGIPPHSIWLIVAGGSSDDIANEIYGRKSYGSGMLGDTTVDITTASNQIFTAKFDRPAAKNLHIRFDIQTTVSGTLFDQPSIKTYIEENLVYGIGDFAETSAVTAVALAGIVASSGGGVPVNVEVSDDGSTWVDYLAVDTLDEQWAVATARITITEL